MSEKILKEVLRFVESGEGKRLMKEISKRPLPKEITNFVREYEKIGGERNSFLWRWVISLTTSRNPGFMLSTVPENYTSCVGNLKTILTLFVSIVDDVADKYKDKKLLKELISIPLEKSYIDISALERKHLGHLKLAIDLWKYIEGEISKFPRFSEFEEIFLYDTKQMLNSFYHSYLINKIQNLINLSEAKVYGGHNMIFFLYSDIDLIASPAFDMQELHWLREIIWRAQQMARIGNWVSTWERELNESDFSSGIFAYAIIKGILTTSELKELQKNSKNRDKIARKIKESEIEKYFLREWQKNYDEIKLLGLKVKSVDIGAYLKGLEVILKYHLASKGLK